MTGSTSTTMPAVAQRSYGPPDVLQVVRLPRTAPGPGQVRVRVRAVAVSRAEAHMRAADPPVARLASGLVRPRNPVGGGELGGEVLDVGPGVTGVAPGDRVVAVSLHGGGYAEEATVDAAATVRVPDAVGLEDAVAVVEGGLTALPFLRDHGRVGPGTRLLVHGASGAVGVMAVQLGVHLGAVVTGVCSDRNVELVRGLGAHHVVDRSVPGADGALVAVGEQDVVLDAVGAAPYPTVRALLAPRGRYLTTGPSAGILLRMLGTRLRPGPRATLATTGLRPVAAKVADMAHLLGLTAAGDLRAVIDRRFPLEDVVEAHRLVDGGRKRGTVLLVP